MSDTARRHRASSKSTQLADIAERTGYSLATVSKVLNGRSDVAAGTRQIIEEALRDSGYTKRVSASKNRRLIETVFQNFDNIWSLEVLRGIVHEASAHEMSVVTTESGDRTHPDAKWIDGVLRRQPLGVVLVFSNLTESEKSRLQAFNIDYVTLDPAGDPSPDNLSVQADNWTGGLIATRHLLSLGHTRIGIITGPNSMLCSKARLDGYKAALDEHDIPFDPDLVREGDFSTAGGYLQGLSLLKNSAKRPTAIFAGSDLQSMGVYEAARTLDLKIPEQLSVIGFDDVQTAAHMGPALTTVRQPLQDMAAAAVRMIIDKSHGQPIQNRSIYPTTLIVRDSTRPLEISEPH